MKNLLLIILFASSSNFIKAQDTLTMRSGENIIVKIIDKIFHEEKNYKFKYISYHKEKFDLDSIVNIGSGIYLTPRIR